MDFFDNVRFEYLDTIHWFGFLKILALQLQLRYSYYIFFHKKSLQWTETKDR